MESSNKDMDEKLNAPDISSNFSKLKLKELSTNENSSKASSSSQPSLTFAAVRTTDTQMSVKSSSQATTSGYKSRKMQILE